MSIDSINIDSQFNREPDCCASLGELRPSTDKTIFYKIPLPVNEPPKPYPERNVYKWSPTTSSWILDTSCSSFLIRSTDGSSDWVKMPFSVDCHSKNKLVESSQWSKIVKALTSKPITSTNELILVIKAYNPNLVKMNFDVLKTLIDECYTQSERDTFFTSTLPKMISLTVELPKLIRKAIPILKQRTNHSLFFSQQQLASLLCNAFFCTFSDERQPKLPDFSFTKLFSHPRDASFNRKLEKLKCIVNYFKRIVDETPTGIVSFERRHLEDNEIANWSLSDCKLKRISIRSDGTIESHGFGMLQADFANRYVGGGVLRSGLVQEEIRFVMNPELMVSMLFTEVLLENEVLLIAGTEQFNKYFGYGDTFRFDGNYYDPTSRDEWGRRYTKVVAMDAFRFNVHNVRNQYKKSYIDRELIKAYTAFMERRKLNSQNKCAIATGNWGCGAFRGDPQLKSLLQLIAASICDKDLVYFTFGDTEFATQLNTIVTSLTEKNVNIGQLYHFLRDYGHYVTSLDLDQEKEPLFDYIQRKFLT